MLKKENRLNANNIGVEKYYPMTLSSIIDDSYSLSSSILSRIILEIPLIK